MEYYLLQNYKDRLTKKFIDGEIDVDTYFKIDTYLDNRKKIYTINLN